jgi:hypothetical protein
LDQPQEFFFSLCAGILMFKRLRYAAAPKSLENELFGLMSKCDRMRDFDDFLKARSKQNQFRLIELRAQYRPDSYALAAELNETASREVPHDGKLDVVSCQ